VCEPLSASECVVGGIALVTVAMIAFGGIPFTQARNALPAPQRYASVSIDLSQRLARLSIERPSELSEVPTATNDGQSPDTRSNTRRPTSIEWNSAERPRPSVEDRWLAANASWPVELRIKQYGINVDSRGVFGDGIWGPLPPGSFGDPAPTNSQRRVTDAPSLRADPGFIGGWTDNTGRCPTARKVPLVINSRAAKTANGECDFGFVAREAANRWRVRAMCAAKGKFWRANIALKLTEPKLTWSSERGTATYVRCKT
jgi:hypothetical protein